MGGLSRELEQKRRQLAGFASRQAFDSYLRHGRVPEAYGRLAEAAADEKKFLEFCSGLSLKALGDGRATTHYVWRTAGDERVRSAHAAHEGQIFSWANPPAGGNPGAAFNCRCWAEPYYGNPAIPDALLQLRHNRQADAAGTQLWASIETLRRPDGSLAQSAISGRDGTQFRSSFSGTSAQH